jgi:hypothetical protein
MNRSICCTRRACDLGNVPACHSVIEETKMGHYSSVCACSVAGFVRLTPLRSFLDLLAHFITRSLQFARARLMSDTNEELLRWSIPLTVVGK